ncbi:hypothetical protein D3C79_909330 [compost metagenome]
MLLAVVFHQALLSSERQFGRKAAGTFFEQPIEQSVKVRIVIGVLDDLVDLPATVQCIDHQPCQALEGFRSPDAGCLLVAVLRDDLQQADASTSGQRKCTEATL